MRKTSMFGTDGVRGRAMVDLTPDLALGLGRAVAARVSPLTHRPRFLVAKDTRLSGDVLEAALSAGLCAGGADVIPGGVMPVPAVAFLARELDLAGAVMVSASHNAYDYNGFKLFGPGGRKLSDSAETDIARRAAAEETRAWPRFVGRVCARNGLLGLQVFGRELRGMTVAVDCGHGAMCAIAPDVLRRLGAEVVAINSTPNGRNINEGGAVIPERLSQTVRDHGAHAGLAFDGDGDRVAVVDESGCVMDGDQILAVWAADLAARGRLTNGTVVGTVMTNTGLEEFLHSMGCRLIRARVGDRYVAAEMQRTGTVLGGETSGHVIFGPHLPVADGLYTGLSVLGMAARSGRPVSVFSVPF